MIFDVQPEARVKVPTQADFLIRAATAFSTGELIGVTPILDYRRYDGAQNIITGQVSGTDFIFLVTDGIFSPGEWTINPEAVVNGHRRRWPRPAILVFEDPLAVSGCAYAS